MTLTEQIADYAVQLRYEDLPPAVVDKAKELLVLQLGAAFRGATTRSGRAAVSAAVEISGSDRGCSIIGERRRAGLLEAVLANASLMTAAGVNDLLFPSGTMAGMVVHPAAWTVSERAGASGRDLLTAIVIGYDAMAKLHSGELPYELAIPRPTKAAVEPLGVAASAARLLGLDREHIVSALGHAGQSVMSIYAGMSQQWLMHPLASRNGVLAAMLARADLPASSTIVEGDQGLYRTIFMQDVPDHVRANLATLGHDFELAKAWTTRHPVSAGNALPIELTQQLAAAHGLTPSRITAIDLVLPTSRKAREAIYGVYAKGPTTVVAIALTDGRFDSARFDEPLGADVLAMRDKVRLRFEDGHGFFYARVEIVTTDGQRFAAEGGGETPAKQPPLDWAEWLAPGRDLIDAARIERLTEFLRHLEDVNDVSEVLAQVVPPAS
jgi:2-methylcitrate dehydratase PrpD